MVDVEVSEPDLSDDSMGLGMHGETQEQIEQIQNDAPNDPHVDPEHVGDEAPAVDNRPTRAPIWKHYIQGKKKSDGSYTATCKYCGKVYPMGNQKSTASMKSHIKRSCKKLPSSMRKRPHALQMLLQNASNTEGPPKVANWVFNQAICRASFARMIVAHEYPFNCANHYFLKVFLSDLQPSFKLPTRNTVRTDCLKIYDEERSMLYDLFGSFTCKLSFTSDLWTSKSGDRGFMALTCHYIDDNWVLRKRIVNFTPLPSPHTGKHIAEAIYEKLVRWNIDKKVFTLVLDNASSNDVCIKTLLTTPLKKYLPVNDQMFHLRCGCHILNLIVQDGLACLTGMINNIRESMKYIRHSQSRMEKFGLAKTQAHTPNDKKPKWDVHTRWNSTYIMLELALELKSAINRFVTLDSSFTYCPSEEDWNKVEALVQCLKVFYDTTKKFSGIKYPTLNIFFPEYCEVSLFIKNMASSPYPFVVEMGKEMFKKWDKYWTSGNMILAMGCVLDPRCKLFVVEYYMKMLYPEDYVVFIDNLKACLNELFKEYSSSISQPQVVQAGSSSNMRASSSSSSAMSGIRAGLRDFLSGKQSVEPTRSELEEYLSEPLDQSSVDDLFDILAWWKLKTHKYPIMSRLTRDLLAIPVSTVASESAFSTAGRTLSQVRNSLNDESMEALICCQDWLRASITENGLKFGATSDELEDENICGSAAGAS